MPRGNKEESQRDRGYTNILHHLTKNDTKQNQRQDKILNLLKKIMATTDEAAQELSDIKSGLSDLKQQLEKALAEIQAKIQALIDAAANTTVDPALQTAIDDVKSLGDALKPVGQALDDIVPDTASGKRKK